MTVGVVAHWLQILERSAHRAVPGPVSGWRWWLVPRTRDPVPASPTYLSRWWSGTLTGRCLADDPRRTRPGPASVDGEVPHDRDGPCRGRCGIHLAAGVADAVRFRSEMCVLASEGVLMFGRADGWGRVVAHDNGWRVRHARISAVVVGPPGDARSADIARLLVGVARRLGVGVLDPAGDRDLEAAWGITTASGAPGW